MKTIVFILVLSLINCSFDPFSSEKQTNISNQSSVLEFDQVPDSCQTLLEAIRNGDDELQLEQLNVCSESNEVGLMAFLLELLKDNQVDSLFKMDLVIAIGKTGNSEAVPSLIRLLEQDMVKRTGLSAAIIPSLGMLKDKTAVPVLLKALNQREDDWMYRNMAAVSLGQIGDISSVEALNHASYMADTRDDAIQSLAQIGDERSVFIFLEAVNPEEEIETREAALLGLNNIGDLAIPEITKVIETVNSEYPAIESRKALIQLLSKMKTPKARATLEEIASRKEDPIMVQEAERVLSDQ